MSHLCQGELSLDKKKSTTEIRVIIFQMKWGSAAANLSASERSERKKKKKQWTILLNPIWDRSGLFYYLTARVYFCVLLAITFAPHSMIKGKKKHKPSLVFNKSVYQIVVFSFFCKETTKFTRHQQVLWQQWEKTHKRSGILSKNKHKHCDPALKGQLMY